MPELKRYRNLINSIPHLVLRVLPDGILDNFNYTWYQYTGMSQSSSERLGWQEAIYEQDLESLLNKWSVHREKATYFEVECRIRRHDGVYRWHAIKMTPEKDENSKLIAWFGTGTDVQDLKDVEKSLLKAQRKMEFANNVKTQFLSNMSHELRTPLNVINGFADLMLGQGLSEEEKISGLEIIKRNSHHLLKIIDQLLDISKIESDYLNIEQNEINLISTLSHLYEKFNTEASKKNLSLDFSIKGKLPEKIITDANRLIQVLSNVIQNGIKFTRSGGVEVSTSFITKSNGKTYVRVFVSDTGMGVSEVNSRILFLSKTQATATRSYGGRGVGLAVARKLARLLGGDVWLHASTEDVGSTFAIEIEVEVVSDTPWVSSFYREKQDSDVSTENESTQDKLFGIKILLAEDIEDNQLLIRHYLRNTGATIDVAKNGKEAIDKALSNNYSLVLMDIQMPIVDGYEATHQLRKAGYKRPIIALTAHVFKEDKEKALQIGCNAHLSKPIDASALIESIAEHVN